MSTADTVPPRILSLIPGQPAFFNAKVVWVRHWNEHLFSFAIERPASFRFRSGEFVMIGLPQDGGKAIMRAYSIASPHYSDELEFLSIKVADGPLTAKLQRVQPGDELYLGRKPTGTLVLDALLPGKRLFMLSTGTGLAPFLSMMRDPGVYDAYEQIVLVHSVRRVSDLAYHDELRASLPDDPLVAEEASARLRYIPTVTREPFHTTRRIGALLEDAAFLGPLVRGDAFVNPETDRIMLCGSTDMIRQSAVSLENKGFFEGSNTSPGDYVIERAFVG